MLVTPSQLFCMFKLTEWSHACSTLLSVAFQSIKEFLILVNAIPSVLWKMLNSRMVFSYLVTAFQINLQFIVSPWYHSVDSNITACYEKQQKHPGYVVNGLRSLRILLGSVERSLNFKHLNSYSVSFAVIHGSLLLHTPLQPIHPTDEHAYVHRDSHKHK